MSWRFSSIRAQLLVLLLAATLLPLGVSFVQLERDRADAGARATQSANDGAELAATQVSDLLHRAIAVAGILEQTPSFWPADDAERDRQLGVLATAEPIFSGLMYFTGDLMEHGSSNHVPGAPRLDLSSRVYAREVVATGQVTFASEPLVALTSKQVVLPVAIPLRAAERVQPNGFLVAGLRVHGLPTLWSKLPLPDRSTVMLLDTRDGTILTASGNEDRTASRSIGRSALAQVRSSGSYWVTADSGGEKQLRSTEPIPASPWVVAVDVPEASVFASVDAEAVQRGATALFVGGLTLAALALLWWRLAARVGALQEAAAHWSAGNWAYRSRLLGSDEFGQVAASFDRMAHERLLAEAALRDSEERFRLLVEGVSDFAMLFLGPEGRIITWNVGAQKLLGYTADEVLGRPFSHFFSSEDRVDELAEALLRTAKCSGRAEGIAWYARKDGSRFWAEAVLTASLDGRGILRGFASVIRDLTDRKRADDAQHEHALHLAEIFEVQSEVVRAERDPRVVMNLIAARAQALTGAAGAAVELLEGDETVYAATSGSANCSLGLRLKIDASFSGLCVRTDCVLASEDAQNDPRVDLHAARVANARSMLVAPLKHEGIVAGVLKVVSPHTGRFQRREIATLQLMAGVLGAALGQARAFSDRARAEAQAREVAERLGAVLRAATEMAIVGIDLDGTIMFFSEGAERMLGYGAEELVGKSPLIFHQRDEVRSRSAEQGVSVLELFTGIARAGEADTREWTYVRKDGSQLVVSLTVTPMYATDERLVGFIGVAMDITERKALEKLKDEFISIVAHELRTPLTGIRASLGLLVGGVVDPTASQGRRMLDLALTNTERLTRLVNDMLDLERMQSGRVSMDRVDCNLSELLLQAA
ncbi:MAG TPA: PAS domain S-box protein, partial [Chloroflexota bacterium]